MLIFISPGDQARHGTPSEAILVGGRSGHLRRADLSSGLFAALLLRPSNERSLAGLAATSALSFSEILGALCRRGKRTPLLEVQRLSGPHFALACGPSLDWIARVIPEDDRRLDGLG